MKEILTYVVLDGKKEDEEEMFDKDIDLDNIISKAKEVSNYVIFKNFFEEPHEDMIVSLKYKKDDKRVEVDIYLRDAFYQKNIGKYMDADEILMKLMIDLETDLDAVCWKSAAGGCGGGCHG
jgi:hypothetical protein